MKALLLIILLASCRSTQWHFGSHRLELEDSFRVGDTTHYVFHCYKEDCPYRDTFAPLKLKTIDH